MSEELCPGCGTPDPGERILGMGPLCSRTMLDLAARAGIPVRDDVVARRFIKNVDMGGPIPPHTEVEGPCWLWTGAKTDEGYGVLRVGGQLTYVHVWVAEQTQGKAPPGYQWDHRCHHPDHCPGGKGDQHRRCVNPAHLRLVTERENKMRGGGPTAVNARKTHCNRQHPLTEDNIYRPPKRPRERRCRRCIALGRQRAAEAARASRAAVARISSREARTG